MRAQISVVVPTYNAEPQLGACLAALMEGVEQGLIRELIVSDGGSTDASGAIAQAWGAKVVSGDASRGGQLKRGVAAANGDWLLIVHADTVLSVGWTEIAKKHFLEPEKAGWFKLAFDRGGVAAEIVAGWANLRSRLGLPYGDQGLLIHRELYQVAGGYPDQPLMEDVAIARRLRAQLVGLDAVAVTSASKYQQQGWMQRGGKNLWTLARYFMGVAPETLAREYHRNT